MSEVIDYSTRPKPFCCCIPFVVAGFLWDHFSHPPVEGFVCHQ
jgi:hypothetical protein